MNYRTFIVFLLLALPVQLNKFGKDISLGSLDFLLAVVTACIIALFWAFIARWIRVKFAPNLTDSYINKIQAVFAFIGVLLIVSVFLGSADKSSGKNMSMFDEASLLADVSLDLIKECRKSRVSSNEYCDSLTIKLEECVGGYRKPKDELIPILENCREKISAQLLDKK